jgi:hypothetical protein
MGTIFRVGGLRTLGRAILCAFWPITAWRNAGSDSP